LAVSLVALGILLVGGTFFARNWPFTRNHVLQEIAESTSSNVTIGPFHHTFFPPGCVAEQVVLRRGAAPESQAKMTVRKMIIQGSWTGLLSKHVALIRLEGADVVFPPIGSGEKWTPSKSDVTVDQLIAEGAMLQFIRRDRERRHVQFPIQHFVAHHLSSQRAMEFQLRLTNPAPYGEVSATGSFGPWNLTQVTATPLSGAYSFQSADLASLAGIRGSLSSLGKFSGTLDRISVEGETTTPDFGIKEKPNSVSFRTEFQAEVTPGNGDVALRDVQVRINRSLIKANGTVAGEPGHEGKTASVSLSVRGGRMEDLMLMFVPERHSPLRGAVSLHGKCVASPGQAPFLRRLHITGDFGIEGAEFTKNETQLNVDKLSASARGEGDSNDDPEDVVSDLLGHVVVRDGVATFSDLSFRVPGAKARMHGTFDLITKKVDLRGLLFMDATLPKATSGIKSFLLKAIDPFLKKNRTGGAKFPVRITGTYEHPIYRADPL
jgi:hypothetical protein